MFFTDLLHVFSIWATAPLCRCNCKLLHVFILLIAENWKLRKVWKKLPWSHSSCGPKKNQKKNQTRENSDWPKLSELGVLGEIEKQKGVSWQRKSNWITGIQWNTLFCRDEIFWSFWLFLLFFVGRIVTVLRWELKEHLKDCRRSCGMLHMVAFRTFASDGSLCRMLLTLTFVIETPSVGLVRLRDSSRLLDISWPLQSTILRLNKFLQR